MSKLSKLPTSQVPNKTKLSPIVEVKSKVSQRVLITHSLRKGIAVIYMTVTTNKYRTMITYTGLVVVWFSFNVRDYMSVHNRTFHSTVQRRVLLLAFCDSPTGPVNHSL